MTDNLTTEQAALRVGLSASSLAKLRVFGGGPKFLKLGRAVRYAASDIEDWLGSRRRTSTSEAA